MFLDYYNLSPLLMQIHAFLCSVMPEWLALTLEGLAWEIYPRHVRGTGHHSYLHGT